MEKPKNTEGVPTLFIHSKFKSKMEKINWFTADTADNSIILYGEIEGKKIFKITWKKDKYTVWKKQNARYQIVEHCKSLKNAQKACIKT